MINFLFEILLSSFLNKRRIYEERFSTFLCVEQERALALDRELKLGPEQQVCRSILTALEIQSPDG